MNPLERIADWPVANAAAAVVGPAGVVATAGELTKVFRLASVTKLLTATAVLVAVEEETVALDEAAGPAGSTVRHLLAHASGLSFEGGPIVPPGRRRIYSNIGFDALGEVVAAGAAMPFVDYLGGAVLEPLGMTSSELRGSPAKMLWSTVDDLTRFAGELLGPSLVSPRTLAAAMGVAFPGLDGVLPGIGPQRPLDWGLGFEIRAHKSPHWTGTRNSPRTVGHFGGAGTFFWLDPEVRLACICLTDREFDDEALPRWRDLSDAVLDAFT